MYAYLQKLFNGYRQVAEIAKKIKKNFYINVQGDEPFINLEDLRTFLNTLKSIQKK